MAEALFLGFAIVFWSACFNGDVLVRGAIIRPTWWYSDEAPSAEQRRRFFRQGLFGLAGSVAGAVVAATISAATRHAWGFQLNSVILGAALGRTVPVAFLEGRSTWRTRRPGARVARLGQRGLASYVSLPVVGVVFVAQATVLIALNLSAPAAERSRSAALTMATVAISAASVAISGWLARQPLPAADRDEWQWSDYRRFTIITTLLYVQAFMSLFLPAVARAMD